MSIGQIPDVSSNVGQEPLTQEEARTLVTLGGEARSSLVREDPRLAQRITQEMVVEAARAVHREGGVRQSINAAIQALKERLRAAAIL